MALMGWRRRYFVYDVQRRRTTYWTTEEAAASNDESSRDYRGTIDGMRRLERAGMQVDILAKSGRVFMLKMEHEDEAQSLEQAFRAEAVQGIASARVRGGHVLSFDGVVLGRTGAETLAVYLRANTTLHTLDIRGTDIGDEGAKHIAAALPKCK